MLCAWAFALLRAGNKSAARIAMIAMTTRSSIKVKPLQSLCGENILRPLQVQPKLTTIFPSTQVRDLLSVAFKGHEHTLGDWGFTVDASPQAKPATPTP